MSMTTPQKITSSLFNYFCEFDAEALMKSFHQQNQTAEDGIIRNFLGCRITPSVYPSVLTAMDGTVECLPHPGNWHADIAEWAAALRSVELAKAKGQGVYRIVELGCGWGCWITNMGVAARSRGMAVDLIGIEGDRYHLESASAVLKLNGFTDADFSLHHGVAGPKPGKAIFPLHAVDGSNWGAEPKFYPGPIALAVAKKRKDVQILNCFTLADLTKGQPIDLLHIDIQGAEFDYVRGNFIAIKTQVKRVLIGTHSRQIEGLLCGHFLDAGWRMEMERPAITLLQHGRPETRVDGVQMWANPVLG